MKNGGKRRTGTFKHRQWEYKLPWPVWMFSSYLLKLNTHTLYKTPLPLLIHIQQTYIHVHQKMHLSCNRPNWKQPPAGEMKTLGNVAAVQLLSCVRLFATPWTTAHPASLSFTISQRLFSLLSIESVMPCNHLIPCFPLLPLPSVFPSIAVFSSESALPIRWPKDCGFGCNSCNEWIFRVDSH